MATRSSAVAAATPPAAQPPNSIPQFLCSCYFLNTNLPAFLLFVPSLVSHNKTTVGWPRSESNRAIQPPGGVWPVVSFLLAHQRHSARKLCCLFPPAFDFGIVIFMSQPTVTLPFHGSARTDLSAVLVAIA